MIFVKNMKACLPIEVTELGIVIFFNDMHQMKAPIPIDVNDDGISNIT